MKYQPNRIKVDFASYRHYIRGIKKIGKTTLFRDIIKEAYGDYRFGFLIACGNESGYKALDGIYAQEALTWKDFTDIVTDLVENKQDNEFKSVGLDTVDELVSIASDEVLKIHYRRKQERVDTLNAALGGYGAGHKMVSDLINDQLKRLEGAGYGLVFIGHTKVKDIKEKDGREYQALTSNLESRFDGIFTDKADVIATCYLSKDIKDKELKGTERFIYFRNDGFVDAGSRFANMPECVPMTAKDYLAAIETGIRSSFIKEPTAKEIEKMKEEEVNTKAEKANAFVEKAQKVEVDGIEPQTVEEWRNAITKVVSEYDKDTQKEKSAKVKEAGLPVNYKTIEDPEILKRFFKIISG